MKNFILASRFKKRRKELKLSQKELAEGICEQSQISRIERGNYTPGADILYLLSKRMSVPMEYFFDDTLIETQSDLTAFKNAVKIFLDNREYESLKYLYSVEVRKHNRLSVEEKFYMMWIDAMVKFYCDKQQKEAVTILEKMIKDLSDVNLAYINILNTLLNFYFETQKIAAFEDLYQSIKSKMKNLDCKSVDELELYIKVRYNICRYIWLNNDLNLAKIEVEEAIHYCKKQKVYFQLANLFCLYANILKEISNHELEIEYYQKALFLYRLEENKNMVGKIEEYLSKNAKTHFPVL